MKNLVMTVIVCALFFLNATLSAFSADEPAKTDLALYKNNEAHFSLKIPSRAVENSMASSRITWVYAPTLPNKDEKPPGAEASSESLNITIRLNYVLLGVAIDYDEYVKILRDTKKNEGIETRPVEIRNGRGFSYDMGDKKNDSDMESMYLVAVSDRGWVCSVTISGKWGVLRRDLEAMNEIIQSFEFLPVSKK